MVILSQGKKKYRLEVDAGLCFLQTAYAHAHSHAVHIVVHFGTCTQTQREARYAQICNTMGYLVILSNF